MADDAGPELPYGHLGKAIYDPDEQTWTFERNVARTFSLVAVGAPRLVAKPAEKEPSLAQPQNTSLLPGQKHPKQIQDLVKRYPEVQPASDLLPPLLRVSEAVEFATACHDPTVGDLLAIGSIPSEASHQTISVAASPTGPTGSDLRIVQVQNQRRGWDDTRDAWISVPTIHGEQATWRGEVAPIQQICFARAIEKTDAFLAVRLLTRTIIFQPIMRKEPVSDSNASRLDPKIVFEVPIALTGGLPHADVAFNPWFTRQFGIVDGAGRWSVWEVEGRINIRARCICTGYVIGDDIGSAKTVDDGWTRITWVHNPNSVAICTRRQLTFHTITEDGIKEEDTLVVLDLSDTSRWLLGVSLVPSQPSHLCVLTSSHLMLYQVGIDAKTAKLVTNIRHFRNPEDMTLSLSVFQIGEHVLFLVHSRLDPIMTQYKLRFESNGGTIVADSSQLGLSPDSSAANIAGMHLVNAPFGTKSEEPYGSLALRYRDEGIRFCSFAALGKDLELQQALYFSAPSAHHADGVLPPAWERRLGMSMTKVRKERFVVNDEEDVGADEFRSRQVSLYMQRRMAQRGDRNGVEWTISFGLLAQAIQATHWEGESTEEVVAIAKDVIRSHKMEDVLPWRTLRELSQDVSQPADIEGASVELDGLAFVLERHEHAVGLSQDEKAEVQASACLTIGDTSQTPEQDLFSLYNDMVRDWITPLSTGVPGRVRLAKDQLARRVAAEVALASRIIKTEPVQQPPQRETQPSQQSWQLPLRRGPLHESLPPSSLPLPGSSQLAASQQSILPTPSPSATPSVVTSSSHPSTFTAPEISRLSRYTTFSKPAISALPRSLNNVLTHWTVGADPSTYDWRSTSRRLAQREDEEGDEHMTEKERLRMQRKAERHIRRQRREAAASQAAHLASSQAPMVSISASQPQAKVESQPTVGGGGDGGGMVESNQSQGLGIGPTSQVVPGRFGGRPPPKKKRKQGF